MSIDFHVPSIYFLFIINDFHPDPFSCPGELSSRFLLFPVYFMTTKELHALNSYHAALIKAIILTIIFFLISVKM